MYAVNSNHMGHKSMYDECSLTEASEYVLVILDVDPSDGEIMGGVTKVFNNMDELRIACADLAAENAEENLTDDDPYYSTHWYWYARR